MMWGKGTPDEIRLARKLIIVDTGEMGGCGSILLLSTLTDVFKFSITKNFKCK